MSCHMPVNVRIATFKNCSNSSLRPLKLAQAGFYQCAPGQIKCSYCDFITDMNACTEDLDQLRNDHRKRNPHCNQKLSAGTPSVSRQNGLPGLSEASQRLQNLKGLRRRKSEPVGALNTSVTEMPSNPSARSDTESPEFEDIFSGQYQIDKDIIERKRSRPDADFKELMKSESNRLQTFFDFETNSDVRTSDLAEAGFFYLGNSDRTMCAFCYGVLVHWETGDLPREEHLRHFPNCAFINGEEVGNITKETKCQTNEQLATDPISPKLPYYADESHRLATFSKWPKDKKPVPVLLANAGFFYTGLSDRVKCFYCGGSLQHLKPYDNPWHEHAHLFPQCPFVKQNADKDAGVTGACSQTSILDFASVMNAVVEMGYHRDLVQEAAEELQSSGVNNVTTEGLVEAISDLQNDKQRQPNEEAQNNSKILSEQLSVSKSKKRRNRSKKKKNQSPHENISSEPTNLDEENLEFQHLKEQNKAMKDARLCKVCMDADVNIVFLPCGHLVCCSACAPHLRDCPVCRAYIKGTVRAFLS